MAQPTPPPGFSLTPSGIAMPTDLRASTDALSDLKHPTAWLQDWAGGLRNNSGVAISPQSSMGLSAYYACIRLIAEDCAKLPLQVLERLPRGRQPVPEHWLWPIVHDEMNRDMTAMTGREVLYHHALGWGNGYGIILRDRSMTETDGEATGIYPVHPSRVTVERNRVTGDLQYRVTTDDPTRGTQRMTITVQAEDMIHIKGLGGDGITGYSVCQFAAESLGLSLAAQGFGASFFGNSTRMGGVLETPGQLSDVALKHLKESFAEQYGGPTNVGKNLILEEGLKYNRMGIPPNEAQFIETRQFQLLEVCRWFRVQPHKIADLENAHHTNIESQNIEHVTDTLQPWLVRGEQELNRKLLSGTPYYVKHDIRGLLRGDSVARADYYHKQFMVGALSPNDIRELEDQNPYEGGDEYFLQIQYAPVRKIVDGTARQPAGQPGRPSSPQRPADTQVPEDTPSVDAHQRRNGTYAMVEEWLHAPE